MSEAKQDGPNTHHFRTFKRGTEFVQSSVHYPDGEIHTFHIPVEAYGPQKPIEVEVQEHIESLESESQRLRQRCEELERLLHRIVDGGMKCDYDDAGFCRNHHMYVDCGYESARDFLKDSPNV